MPDQSDKHLTENTNSTYIEIERIDRAYKLSLYGLIIITFVATIMIVAAHQGLSNAGAISEVVSPFLTVLGTLVGTLFGVQAGSSGREKAQKEAEMANRRAEAYAASMPPEVAETVRHNLEQM